ncbi:hypothetical protein Taro_018965 [Colocasia esculenta]|uniref:Uncharacterized protein n=1 Tax=Colocasia esculenta TaxID=4460 RepID=A0A843UXU6_COLES|nr:hypothetical protein [Colocasia esculenta]
MVSFGFWEITTTIGGNMGFSRSARTTSSEPGHSTRVKKFPFCVAFSYKLKEKVAFRNPYEFYFKMINTKVTDGVHRTRPESLANSYSQEELMLMKTQDAGYILQKVQSERKVLGFAFLVHAESRKLRYVLHSLDTDLKNKHIYFAEDRFGGSQECG